jgi:putative ABC transport system ATP-binding protein
VPSAPHEPAIGASWRDDAVVRATGLHRRFAAPGGDVVALDDVTVSAAAGSLTLVAGASGSGKSTLLMVLAAADRPDGGRVEVDDVDVTAMSRARRRAWRRERLGLVLAQPADNLTDRHDAIGNVVWAAKLRRRRLDRQGALAFLGELGVADVATASRRALSGGEQQRLAFVCAVVGQPTIVVADEPTASLDAVNADLVVSFVRRLADRGTTLVVASHDVRFVEIADQVVQLDHGRRVA